MADRLASLPRVDAEVLVERARRDAMRDDAGRFVVDTPNIPCVMLDGDGHCVVYDGRPLVCRTQGLPLRYPVGAFRGDEVSAHGGDGSELVWCPLNFTKAPPRKEDVVDAERIDSILAVVNLRFVGGDKNAALTRTPLAELILAVLAAR
jgi:hypothetical protein